jgi:3-hydroxy-9,10-secoandrosta-1,3,5(10)-triene-9,17-dione monooxygenase reductase component
MWGSAGGKRAPAAARPVTPATFRDALGHFCTGVTVITAASEAGPVGFACQAFAAVSLEPPLVLFCPTRTSGTWPAIAAAGRFCVNVLTRDQAAVSAVFGTRGVSDRFEGIRWAPSPGGAPVLLDALTWVESVVETVHETGDHYVVVGRVTAVGAASDARPLLFHRGRYTSTEPELSPPEPWLSWPHPDDWI